jgi:hypothetical protein
MAYLPVLSPHLNEGTEENYKMHITSHNITAYCHQFYPQAVVENRSLGRNSTIQRTNIWKPPPVRFLREKLRVAQLVKKFLSSYGTKRFISVFTGAFVTWYCQNLCLSHMNSVHLDKKLSRSTGVP